MIRGGVGLAVAIVVCGFGAPVANADDGSVFAAYDARQGTDLKGAADAYVRAGRRSRRTGKDADLRAVIRTDRRLNAVLSLIGGEIAAQTASTEAGAEARRLALREVRAWRRANTIEMRALRAAINGHFGRARRLIRRADRTMLNCFRLGRRAVARFSAAGLSSPNGAVSDGKP